jgi:hypothetical protein
MKCDVCGQEFANSEEVKAHKERDHPVGENGGEPEMAPEPVEEPEAPDPVVRPGPAR